MLNKLAICVMIALVMLSDEAYANAGEQMIEAQQKSKLTADTLSILKKLHLIANAGAANLGDVNANSRLQKLGREVSKVLASVHHAEELGLIARTSFGIAFPESAETSRYDEVFSIAFAQCIQRLRAMKDERAKEALMYIKGQLNLNSHDIERIDAR